MRKQRICRAAVMLAAAVLLCILCNFAAFAIDTPAMRENAAQGVQMLCQEGGTPQLVGGFKSAQLDNFTGVLIIKTAAYTGPESLIQKALGGIRTELPAQQGQTGWEAFCTYADGSLSETGGLSYMRYWHGYTLPLRVLLCVLNLANIQMLLYGVQLALFVLVVLLALRRGLGAALPGLLMAYFLLMPAASGVCLQFAPVTMLTLLCCAALLAWEEQIDASVGHAAFFALVGLLTNYFDLLTFPLVTLGFPLCLLLALRLKTQDGAARVFGLAVGCSVCWALGYGGMWALKWVLAGAAYGWERLGGVLAQIFLRVSSESGGETLSRLGVLGMNIAVITDKAAYLLLLVFSGLASLFPAVRCAVKDRRVHIDRRALALLVPLAIPFLWYIVLANHSFDHTYFTYRNLAVSALAGYTLLACLFAPGKESIETE